MQISSTTFAPTSIIEPFDIDKTASVGSTGDTERVEPTLGVTVTLSAEGTEKSASESVKNADIDASNLPDGVKKILKVIREVQEKIQKKMDELEAIRKDTMLSDKERESKVQGILAELGVLTNQLTTSSNDLHRTENEMKLSAEMKKVSSYLSAPKNPQS